MSLRSLVPRRYRDYFRDLRITYQNGTWEMHWECRMCGQVIKRNTAGAQSHLSKHVRQGCGSGAMTRADG
jgi:hypothetical protein